MDIRIKAMKKIYKKNYVYVIIIYQLLTNDGYHLAEVIYQDNIKSTLIAICYFYFFYLNRIKNEVNGFKILITTQPDKYYKVETYDPL